MFRLLDLERNCIFYNVGDVQSIKNGMQINTSLFDRFDVDETNSNYTKVTYSWIDHIRVKDKIVGRQQKSVSFILFELENVVCFFLNSESKMIFIINKLIEISQTYFTKIDIFNLFINNLLSKKEIIFKLINLHVNKQPTTYNEVDFWEISIEETNMDEFSIFFHSGRITSITLKNKNSYFYLDSQSVVSFNDTDEIREIFDVVIKITKHIK